MNWSRIAEILQCPKCGAEGLSAGIDEVVCKCGAHFPAHDGVLDMMGQQEVPKNFSQDAMRFKPLIRIYNLIWRRMAFPLVTFIPFSKEVKTIMGYHKLGAGYRMLDIACGPGTYSRKFAQAVGNEGLVVGTDASMPMLRQAVQSAACEGLTNLYFIRMAAENLHFRHEQFDGINCTGALHLFDSIEPVFKKIHGMLKPGSVFSCMTFRLSRFASVNAAYRRMGVKFFDPENLREALHRNELECYQSKESRLMLLFSVKKVGKTMI